jgi:hypothetical protein
MSETPLPEVRREVASDEVSARRGSGRPVSAFGSGPPTPLPSLAHAMGNGTVKGAVNGSAPPSGEQPTDPGAASVSLDEHGFLAGLQAAGALRELSLSEIERITRAVESSRTAPAEESAGASRRIDLLEAYYGAGGDAVAALRRRAADRWFVYRGSDGIGAPQLMQRLLGVVPELSGAHLERVGSASGTLVIRLGEHICALDDENEERGGARVSVHEVVRALNVLLERKGVRARLVGLLGDGTREAYLGLPSLTSALALTEADYLTAPDVETLMALTAW